MAIMTSSPTATSGLIDTPYDTRYVALTSLVAALGGLLFGFDLVIISGAVPFFTAHSNDRTKVKE
jgi:MFS transporter, SP family, arabinose:H+ symporter